VRGVIQPTRAEELQATQRFLVSLGFASGSLATVAYTDEGAAGLPKEYVEVHGGGRSAVLHDFRRLELFNGRSRRELRNRGGDKGHRAQLVHLMARLREGTDDDGPGPLDTMAITLAALAAAGGEQEVADERLPV